MPGVDTGWGGAFCCGRKEVEFRLFELKELFDEPDRLPPDIHIYTSSKQPWIVLPPGVPAVEEYYDRDNTWPADSLARRRAVLG